MSRKKTMLFAATLVVGMLGSVHAIEEKNLSDNKSASPESKPAAVTSDSSNPTNEIKCNLSFNLKSWSVFYKSGKGDGTITCDNGEASDVKIRAKGGGLTFGKTHILDGKGTFSKVHNLSEVYGSYASSEAHGGVVKSGDVRAMTKGDVSLAIHGTGKGVDLGIAFGAFKITPL